MLFQYGDVSQLQGKNWNIVELRSEGGCEGTIRRIGKELPSIFKGDPVEVFIPVGKRDLGTFEIKTETYIFIRSINPKKIIQVRQVTGVVWCVCQGQGTSVDRLIYLEDKYIQELIKQAEEEFNKRSDDVIIDSFVRIIDGHARDYCGTVISLDGDTAHVLIRMKTLEILIETPVKNLLLVNPKTDKAKVFYYRDLLDEYYEEYPDEPHQSEELEGRSPEGREEEDMPVVRTSDEKTGPGEAKKRYSKQHTATALIHRAIAQGVIEPSALVDMLIDSMRTGATRPVKNVVILIGVVQTAVTNELKTKNSNIRTYKDVLNFYGDTYRLDPQVVASKIPWIPLKTNPGDIKPRKPRTVKSVADNSFCTTTIITDSLVLK